MIRGTLLTECSPLPFPSCYVLRDIWYISSLSHSYCFSDQGDLTIFNPTAGVFEVRAVARYRLNFYDAERVCELLGASLATYGQLYAAWAAGLEHCA